MKYTRIYRGGADPVGGGGGGGGGAHELPQKFSRLPPLGAILFECARPLTCNPGSAPAGMNVFVNYL